MTLFALMKKTVTGLWFFVIVITGALVLFYFNSIYTNSTQLSISEHSNFNFTQSDFDSHNILKLHGKVDFFYDTLLTPTDFKNNTAPLPSGLITIPGKWNNFKVRNKTINGHGKGTYRFSIIVPKKGWYGLKIKELKSAYSLWVNDEYMGGSGVVSSNKKGMNPCRKRKEYYFLSESKNIEVIIQASNFHHYKGGATDTIIFGSAHHIIDYKNLQIGIEVFIFGILFILFIYHLTLYAYRKKDKSILYFSLLCLAMLLRLGYTGEKILLDIAPFIPWGIAIRFEYISFFTIPIFTVLFAQQLFPYEISQRLVKVISFFCIGFIGVVILTSSTLFSYTPIVFIYTIGIAAFYLLILVFKAVLKKREYSIAIFIGYLIFFIFSINDLLYYSNTIDSAFLMPLGLLSVTFSQAYVLAQKISTAYSKIEVLTDKLTDHSTKLEYLVETRTKVVQNQKTEIERQKNKLQERAEELKITNEQLITLANFKTDMTNMMIHDLKTPLSNIIGFAALPGSIDEFKSIIHSSGWNMQNLIQNILDVEKYQNIKLSLKLSEIKLVDLINKAYDIACFMIYKNHIKFSNLVSENQTLTIDNELILRVFTNIFANATKYVNKDGIIEVSSNITQINGQDFCKINIYNSGEPIPSEKLDLVFHKFVQLEGSDKSISYSTGIGLTFCRMAIEAHGGQIGALSGKEKGVVFWFTLPI